LTCSAGQTATRSLTKPPVATPPNWSEQTTTRKAFGETPLLPLPTIIPTTTQQPVIELLQHGSTLPASRNSDGIALRAHHCICDSDSSRFLEEVSWLLNIDVFSSWSRVSVERPTSQLVTWISNSVNHKDAAAATHISIKHAE